MVYFALFVALIHNRALAQDSFNIWLTPPNGVAFKRPDELKAFTKSESALIQKLGCRIPVFSGSKSGTAIVTGDFTHPAAKEKLILCSWPDHTQALLLSRQRDACSHPISDQAENPAEVKDPAQWIAKRMLIKSPSKENSLDAIQMGELGTIHYCENGVWVKSDQDMD